MTKLPRPPKLTLDAARRGHDRYYVHVVLQTGDLAWVYLRHDDTRPLRFIETNNSPLFAEAFSEDDAKSAMMMTRVGFHGCNVIAVRADSDSLIPDNLRQRLRKPTR